MFNFKIISKNLISQTEAFLHSVVLFKKLKSYAFIDGYIADVRVYNKELSDEEVKLLYNATKP